VKRFILISLQVRSGTASLTLALTASLALALVLDVGGYWTERIFRSEFKDC
jgi:hypothetical protein